MTRSQVRVGDTKAMEAAEKRLIALTITMLTESLLLGLSMRGLQRGLFGMDALDETGRYRAFREPIVSPSACPARLC